MSYIGNTLIPGMLAECEDMLALIDPNKQDAGTNPDWHLDLALKTKRLLNECLEMHAICGGLKENEDYDKLRQMLGLPPKYSDEIAINYDEMEGH